MFGQGQQGRALVHAGGGGLHVVGGALGGLHPGDGGQLGQHFAGQLLRAEEHTEFFDLAGVRLKVGVQVGQDGKTAVVHLFGLGGKQPGHPGPGPGQAGGGLESPPVGKEVQLPLVPLQQGVDRPGRLGRQGAPVQADGLGHRLGAGLAVAAADGGHGVGPQVPDGRPVGGEGVPHAGDGGRHPGQGRQPPPGGGQHHHPPADGRDDGLEGAGRDLAGAVQQGAVQVQGGQFDRVGFHRASLPSTNFSTASATPSSLLEAVT